MYIEIYLSLTATDHAAPADNALKPVDMGVPNDDIVRRMLSCFHHLRSDRGESLERSRSHSTGDPDSLDWVLLRHPVLNLAYRWFCRLGLEGYIRTQGPLIKSQMLPSEQLVSLPG